MGTAAGSSFRICWLSLPCSQESDDQDIHMHPTGLCLLRFPIVWITISSYTMMFWLGSLQLYRERNKSNETYDFSTEFLPQTPNPWKYNCYLKVSLFYSVFSFVWCISHYNFLMSFFTPMDFFAYIVHMTIANDGLT